MEAFYDVAIIGGGINGCGLAADAAMRGLSVILIEKDDLASKTSSSSTKLIHGGLRYLEYYDFSLVKKSLDERQILLDVAPHLVFPLPIVLPYQQSLRPSWFIRTGLFIYDNLSRRNKLPKSKAIKRSFKSNYFIPLLPQYNKGFIFYDCHTDDARLTLSNALQAKAHGADICLHTELINAEINQGLWVLTLKKADHSLRDLKARVVINAAGPWVEEVNRRLTIPNKHTMTLVKGSHLVVHKLYEGQHAYLLQNNDKRIIFVIPYHGYTMIGTTDLFFNENLDSLAISAAEIDYLFKLVSRYFNRKLSRSDIINNWSGVRPLLATTEETPQALSRDYAFHFSTLPAPAISIYGGKITTYRQLARDAINQLSQVFTDLNPSTTDKTALPGASFDQMPFRAYVNYAHSRYHWLESNLRERLLKTYGTRLENILKGCHSPHDLGQHFGQGLYQCEVDYLVNEEWARNCEDILWRRTKLGLHFSAAHQTILAEYLNTYLAKLSINLSSS